MKKAFITALLFVSVGAGCQADEEEMLFVGESEHWASSVTVYQRDGDETYEMAMSYKEAEIKEFTYSVKAENIDFEETDAAVDQQGSYQKKWPISNSPTTSETDEFVVTVQWDGQSEELTLIHNSD